MTDRLLVPVGDSGGRHRVHHVDLVIHVKSDQDVPRMEDVDEVRDVSTMAPFNQPPPHPGE